MELEAFRKSFLARVVPDSKTGCWLWTGGMLPAGYGVATWNRPDSRVVGKPAHRWAWELLRGPIPKGLEIDHICRVRLCVNPDHLGLVTHAENVARGMPATGTANNNGSKTHCPHGHSYTGTNVVLIGGRRVCRTCRDRRDEAKRRGPARVPQPIVLE